LDVDLLVGVPAIAGKIPFSVNHLNCPVSRDDFPLPHVSATSKQKREKKGHKPFSGVVETKFVCVPILEVNKKRITRNGYILRIQ
jgi:hypothetical protein